MAARPMDMARVRAERMRSSALGVFRGRACTFGTRLIHPLLLGIDGEGFSMVRGIARAFTAAAQPTSARRTSIAWTARPVDNTQSPVSPVEIQQWREQPSVSYWTADNDDVFVPRNHDPNRIDEYSWYSPVESVTDASAAGADVLTQGLGRRFDLDEEGSREFWEHDYMPHIEIHIVEPEVQRLSYRGSDSRNSTTEDANAEPGRHATPASLHELEGIAVPQNNPRRHGRIVHTEYDFTTQEQPTPTIPAIDALAPRPRQRSRPLVRDSQRRQGRVWDYETGYIFLTALEHATNIPRAEPETISPHLSNQQLEACGPQRHTVQTLGTGTGYAETDTSRYRDLTGAQHGNKRLPPPPQPERVITVQATVQDARTERRDEVYHPTPLIRSTHFRPVAGLVGHPNRIGTGNEGIGNALVNVGEYFLNGAEIVAETAGRLTGGRWQQQPQEQPQDSANTSATALSSNPPSPPRNGNGAEHSRNPNLSPQRHHRPSNRSSRTHNLSKRKLKSLAGLILTVMEFPTVLTRDGPGSRLPLHLLRPNRFRIPDSNQVPPVPEITLISPTTCSSSSSPSPLGGFGANEQERRNSDDSISSGWMSNVSLPPAAPSPPSSRPSSSLESEMSSASSVATSMDEQHAAGEEEEWKPLSVGTADWVPFGGDWVREFGV
ncbi:MAG: hypothetical protein Q9184_002976 [Pyrenodesmia sp. 2 TL-2023]